MYEIESTYGYILGHSNIGEANKSYRILTRDYGLISAHATSVRKESSKLAYFLHQLAHIELEAIQSRKGYQITGGRLIESTTQVHNFEALGILDRLGALILQMSLHADSDSVLYHIFHEISLALRSLAPKYFYSIELWGRARILHELGYFDIAFSPDISPELFMKNTLNQQDFVSLSAHQQTLERYIQECINQTML
ncbi:MAG: recombination protein O N-terminal domain-containing protein [Patescibacteria group bacterium]